jgi:hypothetical protein
MIESDVGIDTSGNRSLEGRDHGQDACITFTLACGPGHAQSMRSAVVAPWRTLTISTTARPSQHAGSVDALQLV